MIIGLLYIISDFVMPQAMTSGSGAGQLRLRVRGGRGDNEEKQMKVLSTATLLLTLLSFGAFHAFPQAETGQIIGTVADPSGSGVADAGTTVKSVEAGASGER